MATKKRTAAVVSGRREARAVAATLGGDLKRMRVRRHLTQRQLGARVDLSQSEISYIERGHGSGTPLETWIALGIALGRPLAVGFSRPIESAEPGDAGHLAGQELVLRLATATGRTGQFELATRPSDPARSIDVCLRDRLNRTLIVAEIWNRLDDVGAAARSTARKIAEAEDLASLHEPAERVAACWLLLTTAANRALVRRYPAVIRAQFPGSSRAWVAALTTTAPPPLEPGVAWLDVRSSRVSAVALRVPSRAS